MKRRLAIAAALASAFAPAVALADGAMTFEVREQAAGALLPTHDYGVTGFCATGTGVAPASVYANGASGRGSGLGIGIGGRVGYDYLPTPANGRESTWWAFRAAAGLDLHLLYARVPIGIADLSGKLCGRVKSDGAELQYQASSVLLARTSAVLGVELGLKTTEDHGAWRGIVLGAAWAPGISFIKPWVTDGDIAPSLLGAELTVDLVKLDGSTGPPTGERAAIAIALPTDDHGLALVALSFGVVWR